MKTEYDFSKAERGRFFRRSTDRRLPARSDQPRHWAGPDGQLSRFVRKKTDGALRAYREEPERVTSDANKEIAITDELCRHRQVFELIQNSADSLMPRVDGGGSVLVRLTRGFLYCADNGRPLDRDSVTAMMSCHMSRDRHDEEFGRFRIGFKSVLEVTRSPEIFSLSGSFRFDQEFARTRIKEVVSAEHYPVLRIAEPLNPADEVVRDPELHEMMGWANNIVRLPLLPEAGHDLARQLREFPAVFLLRADHVRYLTLADETAGWSKELSLERSGTDLILDDGAEVARWKQVRRDPLVFERCSG